MDHQSRGTAGCSFERYSGLDACQDVTARVMVLKSDPPVPCRSLALQRLQNGHWLKNYLLLCCINLYQLPRLYRVGRGVGDGTRKWKKSAVAYFQDTVPVFGAFENE